MISNNLKHKLSFNYKVNYCKYDFKNLKKYYVSDVKCNTFYY